MADPPYTTINKLVSAKESEAKPPVKYLILTALNVDHCPCPNFFDYIEIVRRIERETVLNKVENKIAAVDLIKDDRSPPL